MSELVRRNYSSSAPVIGNGSGPGRVERRAIRDIETWGNVTRAADIEEGKHVANRIDVVDAVAAHASERHADLIRYQRDLAAGDAGIELELAPLRASALRKVMSMQERLYGVLSVAMLPLLAVVPVALVIALVILGVVEYRASHPTPREVARDTVRKIDAVVDQTMADMARHVARGGRRSPRANSVFDYWMR